LTGIPATGKKLSLEMIIEITRVQNGRIVERWNQRDWLGLFAQLGINPLASAPDHAHASDRPHARGAL
jgi:hypothetical protein